MNDNMKTVSDFAAISACSDVAVWTALLGLVWAVALTPLLAIGVFELARLLRWLQPRMAPVISRMFQHAPLYENGWGDDRELPPFVVRNRGEPFGFRLEVAMFSLLVPIISGVHRVSALMRWLSSLFRRDTGLPEFVVRRRGPSFLFQLEVVTLSLLCPIFSGYFRVYGLLRSIPGLRRDIAVEQAPRFPPERVRLTPDFENLAFYLSLLTKAVIVLTVYFMLNLFRYFVPLFFILFLYLRNAF